MILVTGANGYIGRHVVKTLLNMGYDVTATDIKVDDIDERACRIATDLFTERKSLMKEFGNPSVCLHMAWQDGFNHQSNKHMENLSSHYRFIRQFLDEGLKQIAVIGTMHEIGYWEGAVNEDTPTNPLSMYGIAKNALREAIINLAKQKGAIYQWLRLFYIYGDDEKNKSIFTKIIEMEKEGLTTFPFNSGTILYDFIKVDELTKQIAKTITQKNVDGIINCCSGKPISLREKVEEFLVENNFKIRPEYGKYPDRPYDSPGIWGNPEKIEKIMRG